MLFFATFLVDRATYHGDIVLPTWWITGTADAARQILTAIAAAVITVVGLVFSITIVALTLASTQFGPRMLRNFIRDRGTQVHPRRRSSRPSSTPSSPSARSPTEPGGDFVPHLSITVALGADARRLGVLIYFIHHIADVDPAPGGDRGHRARPVAARSTPSSAAPARPGPAPRPGRRRLSCSPGSTTAGAEVLVPRRAATCSSSAYATLVEIATDAGAVIQLLYRPGHFVVEGLPLAKVWPAEAAADVGAERSSGRT